MVMFVKFYNEWLAAGAWWQLPVTIRGTIMKWCFFLAMYENRSVWQVASFPAVLLLTLTDKWLCEWISHSNSYLLTKVTELSCRPEQIDRDFISSVLLRDSLANGQERPRIRQPAQVVLLPPAPSPWHLTHILRDVRSTLRLATISLCLWTTVSILSSVFPPRKARKKQKGKQKEPKSKSMIANA